MDSSAASETRKHSPTVQKGIDILFPATKRRQTRRTYSFSSISSLSSCSSSLESPYFPDDFPISNAEMFLSSGVPFSWENFPGIPKNQTPIEKENFSLINLPLPPTLTPPTSKRFYLEQTKKITQTDPFFAALVECSKDEDRPDFRQTNRKLSDSPKVSRSISDRIGLINLYASCKRACAVCESISYVPRSSRRSCHGYDIINDPTSQSPRRRPECQPHQTIAEKCESIYELNRKTFWHIPSFAEKSYTMRVQALAFDGDLKELPAQFIRPLHERPENTKAVENVKVPVISLSQPHDAVVDEISKACREWGFFLLTDHGIPPLLIRRLQEVGQEFFQLPQAEKELYANDPSGGRFEGYGTKMTKNDDQKVEWIDYFFHVTAPPSRVNYDFWIQNPPAYRAVTEEYSKEILSVTEKLLRLISLGLGLEENAILSSIGGEELELEMKINMYPPCPQPELALGVEPHTDMSALTLLVPNDVPGLQVWKDGTWVAVDYLPNAIFVHVGDQIEVISNGKYKSVLHRSLVNKDKTRMSWAVFCAPPHDAVIGPLQQLIDDQNPAKYSTKTFAEYRHRKFNNLPQ